MEIARRTVPCYKHVIEKDGEKRFALCILVDSGKLYRFPYEERRASKAWRSRPVSCVARWSTSGFASSSLGYAAMSKEPTKPSESLVQELLDGKARAQGGARTDANRARGRRAIDGWTRILGSGPERGRTVEISARRKHAPRAGNLREERDELRQGVEQALDEKIGQTKRKGPGERGP